MYKIYIKRLQTNVTNKLKSIKKKIIIIYTRVFHPLFISVRKQKILQEYKEKKSVS